jgi:hypothetical protein
MAAGSGRHPFLIRARRPLFRRAALSDRPPFKPALPPEPLPQEPRGADLVLLASGVHPTILYPSPPPVSAKPTPFGPGSGRPLGSAYVGREKP